MERRNEADYDHLFKLLLIGDSGVGKSSILLRFIDDTYDDKMHATIGVDFRIKYLESKGQRVNLTIWDTAGQEKFRSLTSSYYRGTHAIILVYDVTDRSSFENITSWLNECDLYSTVPHVIKMLVGNKIDRGEERQVTRADGASFARNNHMLFIECSAKNRSGVKQAFEEVVLKILDTPMLLEDSHRSRSGLIDASSHDRAGRSNNGYCSYGWCWGDV